MRPSRAVTSLNRTINTNDIKNETIKSGDILNGTVNSADVKDNSLTAGDLAANSVGTSELAANAVNSAKIADGTRYQRRCRPNGTVADDDLSAAAVDALIAAYERTELGNRGPQCHRWWRLRTYGLATVAARWEPSKRPIRP